MDACFVDGEQVRYVIVSFFENISAQQSTYYGGIIKQSMTQSGWVNSWITGGQKGMKGPPGTEGW